MITIFDLGGNKKELETEEFLDLNDECHSRSEIIFLKFDPDNLNAEFDELFRCYNNNGCTELNTDDQNFDEDRSFLCCNKDINFKELEINTDNSFSMDL